MKAKFLITGVVESKKNGLKYLVGLVYNSQYNRWAGQWNGQAETNYLFEVSDEDYEKYARLISNPCVITVEKYINEYDKVSYKLA